MSPGPESTDSSAYLLDAVIESVIKALRAGQRVDLDALAARNPSVANEIRQLVPAQSMSCWGAMAKHWSWIGDYSVHLTD